MSSFWQFFDSQMAIFRRVSFRRRTWWMSDFGCRSLNVGLLPRLVQNQLVVSSPGGTKTTDWSENLAASLDKDYLVPRQKLTKWTFLYSHCSLNSYMCKFLYLFDNVLNICTGMFLLNFTIIFSRVTNYPYIVLLILYIKQIFQNNEN